MCTGISLRIRIDFFLFGAPDFLFFISHSFVRSVANGDTSAKQRVLNCFGLREDRSDAVGDAASQRFCRVIDCGRFES